MDENMKGIIHDGAENLLFSQPASIDGLLGNPEVLPRVGNEYQAQIPSLAVENEFLNFVRKPHDTEIIVGFPNQYSVGLHIPVMWIHEIGNIKDITMEPSSNQDVTVEGTNPREAENSEDSQISSNNYAQHVGEEVRVLPNSGTTVIGDHMDADSIQIQAKTNKLDQGSNDCHLVPGSLAEAWGGVEYDSFLLGLYIFGKNLNLVKRFVSCKNMGDILALYYGKFFKSKDYLRWSDCRKMRNRKYVHGQKIFTGWRQQELLSRLYTHASVECQNMILEVTKKFGEGNLTFEEYIFKLKELVSSKIFVEATAIGKGKQDLTSTAMEPIKTNRAFLVHPEIPSGKACSSLTCSEIIKLLTGDFRLSKARSNDIFWEAVWPRLLAHGWHSEQPKNYGCAGLKHSLVFLVPGVKKFSRRRHVKGNHYFDSVTDVLNKVASEPAILEIDLEVAKGSAHVEEFRSDSLAKRSEISLKQPRHCYLQPRNSGCYLTSMKFTIVDTSLFNGEDWVKVRELRSLPFGPIREFLPPDLSCEVEEDTSEESYDKMLEKDVLKSAEDVTESGTIVDSPEFVTKSSANCLPDETYPKACLPKEPCPCIVRTQQFMDQGTNGYNDTGARMLKKLQFSRKSNSYQSNCLDPIKEKHSLTACSDGKRGNNVENISHAKLNREQYHFQPKAPDPVGIMANEMEISQNISVSSSFIAIQEESRKAILNEKCPVIKISPKKTEVLTKIDLNSPQSSLDCESDKPCVSSMARDHDCVPANMSSSSPKGSEKPDSLNPTNDGTKVDPYSVLSERRHSTRNRPLTTKALEALAFGFLGTKRRRKENVSAPSSRRVNRKNTPCTNLKDDTGHIVASCNTDDMVD